MGANCSCELPANKKRTSEQFKTNRSNMDNEKEFNRRSKHKKKHHSNKHKNNSKTHKHKHDKHTKSRLTEGRRSLSAGYLDIDTNDIGTDSSTNTNSNSNSHSHDSDLLLNLLGKSDEIFVNSTGTMMDLGDIDSVLGAASQSMGIKNISVGSMLGITGVTPGHSRIASTESDYSNYRYAQPVPSARVGLGAGTGDEHELLKTLSQTPDNNNNNNRTTTVVAGYRHTTGKQSKSKRKAGAGYHSDEDGQLMVFVNDTDQLTENDSATELSRMYTVQSGDEDNGSKDENRVKRRSNGDGTDGLMRSGSGQSNEHRPDESRETKTTDFDESKTHDNESVFHDNPNHPHQNYHYNYTNNDHHNQDLSKIQTNHSVASSSTGGGDGGTAGSPQTVASEVSSHEFDKWNHNIGSGSINNTLATVHSRFEHATIDFSDLPDLSSKLQKQSTKYIWQERWVVVRKTYMLWNKKVLYIQDASDPKERKKWKNGITLYHIRDVRAHGDRKKKRFDLVTDQKTYHFKAEDAITCEKWIHGISERLKRLPEKK